MNSVGPHCRSEAAVLQQTAPALKAAAGPGRPAPQTPALHRQAGREAQGGREGERNWRGKNIVIAASTISMDIMINV